MRSLNMLIMVALMPIGLLAQQDTLHKNHRNYIGFGLGLGSDNGDNLYGKAYIFVQQKNNYISLGISSISAPVFMLEDEPSPFTEDLSLTIGKSLTLNRGLNIQFGAGLAYVHNVSRGPLLYNTCKGMFCIFGKNVYETIEKQTIGFPIDIRTNFYLDRSAAISLGLNINLNSVNTYSGFHIGVMVGRLRDRIPKKSKIVN